MKKLTAARVHALRGFTVKVESGKFYICPTAMQNGTRKWKGPYKSLQHATAAIARTLQREFSTRDAKLQKTQ